MCPIASTARNAYDGYGESKLFKVNFTSLTKCGTIEFRQMGSITDHAKIIHWIQFIIKFCATALDANEYPSAEEIVEHEAEEEVFDMLLFGRGQIREVLAS